MPDLPFQNRGGGAPPLPTDTAGSALAREGGIKLSDRSAVSAQLEALKAAILDRVTIPGLPSGPIAPITVNPGLTTKLPAPINSAPTPARHDPNYHQLDSAAYRGSFISELAPNTTRRVIPSSETGEQAATTEKAGPPEGTDKRRSLSSTEEPEAKVARIEPRTEDASTVREITPRIPPGDVVGTEPTGLRVSRAYFDSRPDHREPALSEGNPHPALNPARDPLETQRSVEDIVSAFPTTILREPSRNTASAITEILSRSAPPHAEQPLGQPPQVVPSPETPLTVDHLHSSIAERLGEMRSSVELMTLQPPCENPAPDRPTQRASLDHLSIQAVASPPSTLFSIEQSGNARPRDSARQGVATDGRVKASLAGHLEQERIMSLLTAMELGARRVKILRALQSIDNALETGCISIAALVALGALGLERAAILIAEAAKKVSATIKESTEKPNHVGDSSIAQLIDDLSSTPLVREERLERQGYSTNVDISGRVVYTGTQVPVIGIVIDGGILGTATTDAAGAFAFKRVSAGHHFTMKFPTQKLEYDTPTLQGFALTDTHFVIQAKKRGKRRSSR